jgi:hypothetical protein
MVTRPYLTYPEMVMNTGTTPVSGTVNNYSYLSSLPQFFLSLQLIPIPQRWVEMPTLPLPYVASNYLDTPKMG